MRPESGHSARVTCQEVWIRRDGLPVACEIWPGNTADVTTLKPVVESLRHRFRIGKVVLVCD